ncbi:hypothetical protein N0V90_009020 [Kalmusia sp. IMI 367209]|nr:hypothetical protein N0V90_009020 [Kalmusia sp. IMI 367209]
MFYAGILPHVPSSNTTNLQDLPATNISLGVAGPPYSWLPYAYLETRSLGIDRTRQKLYVGMAFQTGADNYEGIFSVNYDGSNRMHILERDGSTLGGIAVAEGKQKMYYTEGYDQDVGTQHDTRLRRANLDGSAIETVVDMNKMECRLANSTDEKCPPRVRMLDQVVLDEEEEYLYWTADTLNGIWRASSEIPPGYTWANRMDIEHLVPWASPAQFRVIGRSLYWVDSALNSSSDATYPTTSSVYKLDLSGTGDSKTKLLFNVPLQKYESVQGIAVDPKTGEIWVLVHRESSEISLWRFDSSGSGTTRVIRDGEHVWFVTGFEVY